MRETELRRACRALGLEPPHLLPYRDGTLAEASEEEAVEQVLAFVQELRPKVLLTWPSHGLSGHADHVAVSRWASLAFRRAAAAGWDEPVAIYHLAVPRSVASALGLHRLHVISDEAVTVALDVSAVWEKKMAAIRCHRTQLGQSPILAAPPERRQLFLGVEHFCKAEARSDRDFFLELREG